MTALPRFSIEPDTRRFSLHPGSGSSMPSMTLELCTESGEHRFDQADSVSLLGPTLRATFGPLVLTLEAELCEHGLLVHSRLVNTGDDDVRVVSVTPLACENEWSDEGAFLISNRTLLRTTPAERHYGYDGDHLIGDNTPRTSCWYFSLSDPESDSHILCGIDGPSDGFARFDIVPWQSQRAGYRVVRWRCRMDCRSGSRGVRLAPGAWLEPGTLFISFWHGAREQGLRAYARRLARWRSGRPVPPLPSGWCSWYAGYETAIDEAACISNLEAAQTIPGMRVFQIDDGWMDTEGMRRSGEPGIDSNKFPSGLKTLAMRIREAGMTPGLWLRPFQGWKDPGSAPVWARADCVDLSDPACIEWLRESVRVVTRTWDFAYLKLDFLTYDMFGRWGMELLQPQGARLCPSDDTRTNMRLMREGLQAVRTAAGDEVYLLGCNCLFGPAIGILDGMRIGDDVSAWNWDRTVYMGARAAAAPLFLHGILWNNDADCMLFHEPLSEQQLRTWNSFVSLASQSGIVSSVLPALNTDRKTLLRRVFPPPEPDPDRTRIVNLEQCSIVWRAAAPAARALGVLGVFNWSDRPVSVDLRPDLFGLAPGAIWREFWSGESGILTSPLTVNLDPFSSILLGIRDAKGEHIEPPAATIRELLA